jgi:hemerythrin-like domain-containing protein
MERYMKATEELVHEHAAIMQMLDILEKACVRLESGRQVPPEHLLQMVDFFKTFADGCHHSKEEEYLFPALESVGIPREQGPIGVMLSEHDLGRKYMSGMKEALSKFPGEDSAATISFVREARAYLDLLRMHIYKENNVLFPMADLRLSEVRQTELLKEFERLERDVVGAGKHEEYHSLLKTLKGIYLQ